MSSDLLSDEEREFVAALQGMTDDELRRRLREAGEAYEYFGGYWTLRPVDAELKRREPQP